MVELFKHKERIAEAVHAKSGRGLPQSKTLARQVKGR
jgi:hypothetical protein